LGQEGVWSVYRRVYLQWDVLYFNFTFVDLLACVVVFDKDVFCSLVVFRVVRQALIVAHNWNL
jgi:hypothetical protein